MARAGICSRRDAEAWIAEGRVAVNGEVLKSPAFNVSETDDVRVDGKKLAAPERTRLFLFHKPRGLVTTARDPEGRQTVFSVLPPDLPRLVAIGRLDINTEGLLLLTNDGGLARVLELPSTGWLRRYRVRAHGIIEQATLDRLSEGVTIDGVDYMGVEAKLDREQGSNAWLTLGLREGKNREIKKILEHLGLAVNRLIRVSFGPFELGDLPEGEVMEVRTRVLRDQLGVKLAKEATVDFDPAETIAVASPPRGGSGERPRTRSGAPRENRGPKRAMPGRPDRGARGADNRSERDEAPRRAPPAPSTPERRRKHVSALRAEIAEDSVGARKRVERSATHDRKGRTIAVERMSRAVEEAPAPTAPEARPARGGRPNAGERGRTFGAGARGGKPDSFGPKRGRAAAGRERPPHSDHTQSAHRPERPDAARRDGRPLERRFDRSAANGADERPSRARDGEPARERKFDRPQGGPRSRAGEGRPPRSDARDGRPPERHFDRPIPKGDGDRRDRPSRARDDAGPGRERKFHRPQGGPRTQAGEGQPPRSEHREPGHRPERPNAARRDSRPPERRFDRSAASGGGDRRERPSRARDGADPARERKFDRPQGRTRPPAGEGRPPRSDAKGGPRSDFKSRPPRTGARDEDRPRSPGRGPASEGGPPRGRPSPNGRSRPPGKGPPKRPGGGSRRPPRKP
jgi:23S rRNA pseudouridine2605 synthase